MSNLVWIWVGVAVLSVIAEMMTGTLYLLVVALAALATAAAGYVGIPFLGQLFVCGVLCLGGFVYLTKKNPLRHKTVESSEDIGKMVEIVRLSGPGKARVKYRGAEWDAQVNDSVNPGDFVKIIKIDGIMLICSKT